jgi:hypothetical protein
LTATRCPTISRFHDNRLARGADAPPISALRKRNVHVSSTRPFGVSSVATRRQDAE